MKYLAVIYIYFLSIFIVLFEYILFIVSNIASILWYFNFKHTMNWRKWCVISRYEYLGTSFYTDKNIWETYLRYAQFKYGEQKHLCYNDGSLIIR